MVLATAGAALRHGFEARQVGVGLGCADAPGGNTQGRRASLRCGREGKTYQRCNAKLPIGAAILEAFAQNIASMREGSFRKEFLLLVILIVAAGMDHLVSQ